MNACGHLDDAGLEELHLVAAERLEHQVDTVRQVADVGLALADADRLDHHAVEQPGQQPADLEARRAQATQVGLRGLAAEEQAALVGSEAHPRAVAQERSTRHLAGRIDGQHRDRQRVVGGQQVDGEPGEQGGLARARRAGETDDRPGHVRRRCVEVIEHRGATLCGVGSAILEQRDAAGDRVLVQSTGGVDQRRTARRRARSSGRCPSAGHDAATAGAVRASISPTIDSMMSISS